MVGVVALLLLPLLEFVLLLREEVDDNVNDGLGDLDFEICLEEPDLNKALEVETESCLDMLTAGDTDLLSLNLDDDEEDEEDVFDDDETDRFTGCKDFCCTA